MYNQVAFHTTIVQKPRLCRGAWMHKPTTKALISGRAQLAGLVHSLFVLGDRVADTAAPHSVLTHEACLLVLLLLVLLQSNTVCNAAATPELDLN